jgi:hypothetical protein
MNKETIDSEIQKTAKKGREIVDDASAQLQKIQRVGKGLGEEIGAYVREQPVAAVGIAVGAGFVLGSVFGSRLGRLALVAAVGYAAQDLIEGALGEGGIRKLLADEVSRLARDRSAS